MTKSFPDELLIKGNGFAGGSLQIKLTHYFRYFHPDGYSITVPNGFDSDGASVPQIFWNILPPFGSYLPAALIHDFLYSKASNRCYHHITRKMADEIFLQAMKDCGIGRVKRYTIYAAVRSFGGAAYKKK